MSPHPPPAIRRKWRPSLGAVVGVVLSTVMILPLAGMTAVVALTRTPEQLIRSVADNLERIVAAGLVVATVTAIVGILFVRFVSRPIRDMVAWTEAVAAGEEVRAPEDAHYGTKELARLASSFVHLVSQLRDRSAYIATYTAHVSHELKSPLTSIAGAAEVMRDAGDDLTATDRARFLANIEADALRLSVLVARMRELVRAETELRSGLCTLREVAARLREKYPLLQIDAPDRLSASHDPAVLPLPIDDAMVVLSHLADNAVLNGARRLTIFVRVRPDTLAMGIENDGGPIPVDACAKLFEPFYTTRREHGGTGMGLAIARAMLRAHGGDIALASSEVPVRFCVTLPRLGR